MPKVPSELERMEREIEILQDPFERCLRSLKNLVKDFEQPAPNGANRHTDSHSHFLPAEIMTEERANRIRSLCGKVVLARNALEDQKVTIKKLKENEFASDPTQENSSVVNSEDEDSNALSTNHEVVAVNYCKIYHDKLKSVREQKRGSEESQLKKDNTYVTLDGKLKLIINPNENAESSLLMTEAHISVKDPITQQPIKDPVRNIFCQHPYDRASITQYIKSHLKTKKEHPKCPHIGCGNLEPVKMEDLEDYPQLLTQPGIDIERQISTMDLVESMEDT